MWHLLYFAALQHTYLLCAISVLYLCRTCTSTVEYAQQVIGSSLPIISDSQKLYDLLLYIRCLSDPKQHTNAGSKDVARKRNVFPIKRLFP